MDKVKKLLVSESSNLAVTCSNNHEYDKMGQYLKISENIDPNNYQFLLAKSIFLFQTSRNVDLALLELKKASKNKNDFTWAYNTAFLLAYKGELTNAYHYYEIAFINSCELHIHSDVEVFITETLHDEPDKIQFYYCLGLLYLKKMEDHILAKESFINFISKSKETGLFSSHICYAEKFLEECID